MNAKGFSGTRDYRADPEKKSFKENKAFDEFLEVINVFSDTLRKPYKMTVLNSHSLADFISTTYAKFNEAFFANLTSNDSNNLIFIRAVVEQNYELLLKMLNEAPVFMSRKLKVHYQSQRYFTVKCLLLCANLGNPYQQMDMHILEHLSEQLRNPETDEKYDEDEVIGNVLGISRDFFLCLCAAESGDFQQFIKYLASKDPKLMPIASLFCWSYLPFISHLYKSESNQEDQNNSLNGISILLMYGLFNIINIFFHKEQPERANKPDLLNSDMCKAMQNYLNKNIKSIMDGIFNGIKDRPVQDVSWFSIDFKDIWNGMNLHMSSFIAGGYNFTDNKEDIEKRNETYQINLINIMENYGKDFYKVYSIITSYVSEKFFRSQNKEEEKIVNPLFKFFPSLTYGTSGLVRFDLMGELLKEVCKEKNNIIDAFLKGFYKEDSKKKEEEVNLTKGFIQLIVVGFETIEKRKNDRVSMADNEIREILGKM